MADIDISIATSGNPAGAAAVSKAIEEMQQKMQKAAMEGAKVAAKEITALRAELDKVKDAMSKVDMKNQELKGSLIFSKAETKASRDAYTQLQQEIIKVELAAARAQEKIDQVNSGKGKVAGVAGAAAKGTKDFGQSILEVSRGVEDLQYGIRGFLNNIPGIVTALGMGSGVAGVLSLVAVGLTTIVPKLHAWATNTEDATKRIADALAETTKAAQEAKEKRIAAIDAEIEAYDRQIAKTRELRRAEMERVDARAALDLAKVDAAEARGELSPEEAIRARTGIADAQARAKAAAEQKTVEEEVSKATRDATAARAKAREEQAAADAAAAMVEKAKAQQKAEADLPGLRTKVGSFKAAGAQASPEGRAELARMQAEIAAKEALVGAGVPDVESVKKLEENRDAAKAAAKAAAEQSREAANKEGLVRDAASARFPAIRDTLAIDEQRRQVEMQGKLSEQAKRRQAEKEAKDREVAAAEAEWERQQQEEERRRQQQQQIDFSGKGLMNQIGGLFQGMVKDGVNPGGATMQALGDAAKKIGDGVQVGESGNVAAILDRIADQLPSFLSKHEKQIRSLELAAQRLEERMKNLRSEPGN